MAGNNDQETIVKAGEFGGTIPLPSAEDIAQARDGLVLDDTTDDDNIQQTDDTNLIDEDENAEEEESTSTEEDQDLEDETDESDAKNLNPTVIDLGIELPQKGAKYTIKLKDGREFTLPGDVLITSKVDGEIKDYVLHDQMKVAGGEEAIEKRLARVKDQEKQVIEIKNQLGSYEQNLLETQKTLVKTIEEDPVKGLKSVVDALEVPPGEFIRKMIIGVHELQKEIYTDYIHRILPPNTDLNTPQGQALVTEGFRQYLKGLDTDFYQSKLKKQEEAKIQGQQTQQQARQAALKAVEDRGLTKEYANRAIELLKRQDDWGYKKDEQKISDIIEHGKVLWVLDRIGEVDGVPQNYLQNKEFLLEVNGVVDPRVHTPEKAKKLISTIAKDYFSSPNAKNGVDNKSKTAVISKQVLSGVANGISNGKLNTNGSGLLNAKKAKSTVIKSASDIDALFR